MESTKHISVRRCIECFETSETTPVHLLFVKIVDVSCPHKR